MNNLYDLLMVYGGLYIPLLLVVLLFFVVKKRRKNNRRRSAYLQRGREESFEEQQKVERLPSKEEIELEKEKQKEKIVGISKPVGFWTKKVLSEKMQYILASLSSDGDELNYWRSYVTKRQNNKKDKGGREGP